MCGGASVGVVGKGSDGNSSRLKTKGIVSSFPRLSAKGVSWRLLANKRQRVWVSKQRVDIFTSTQIHSAETGHGLTRKKHLFCSTLQWNAWARAIHRLGLPDKI